MQLQISRAHPGSSWSGLIRLLILALVVSACGSTTESTSSSEPDFTTTSPSSTTTAPTTTIDPFSPTAAEVELADAFVRFADSPSAEGAEALPFAAEVSLGLASDVIAVVERSDLAESATWQLDVDEYAGFSGPFSALDHPAPSIELSVGPHDHCANPPLPPLEGFDDLRQIALQPTDVDSCIDWWSVDFYLDGDGHVQAVTLLLFGP